MIDPSFIAAVLVAVITGGASIIATIVTVRAGNKQIISDIKTHDAVQDTKMDELTREVRVHNSFAERIPKIEARLDGLEKRLDRQA